MTCPHPHCQVMVVPRNATYTKVVEEGLVGGTVFVMDDLIKKKRFATYYYYYEREILPH